jgi:PleD family two-component response regulator
LGGPEIRFYAGAPLRLQDGNVAGTLCVIGREPRQLDSKQRAILTCLATVAARALEQWRSDRLLHESVDALHQSKQFLEHADRHDSLTALLNRPEFESQLRLTLLKAKAKCTQDAMLFINLDQFKLVNDSCGHAAGDQLLIEVSKLLSDIVKEDDIVARLSGD